MEPILFAGRLVASSARATLRGVDPGTGEALPEQYPVSPRDELGALAAAGKRAAAALRDVPAERRAEFLAQCADEIEADADALAARAARETGLSLRPRLREIELTRTLDQLRQAAAATRAGAWALPVIDRQHDLASAYFPLGGPVLVIGPSNFPFAYNALSGGDFASAIAAGNPVIGKAHPGHLGTTRLLASCLARALQRCPALPPATVQMFYHCTPEDGRWLVAHRDVAAVGFTGSRSSGLEIKETADRAGKPAYLEMSSVNPVFVLPGALAHKADQLQDDFVNSCLLAAGQMCTNPGLVVLPAGPAGERMVAEVAARFAAAPPGVLLGPTAPLHLASAIEALCRGGASVVVGGKRVPGSGYRFANTLLRASGQQFLAQPELLQTEAFGSASLFVLAADGGEMLAIAENLSGSLTASIYSADDGADDALAERLAPILGEKAGRLLNDRMPTGVAVSPAMHHGGPYPATGHPGFTAVGFPAAIRRFAKLTCFDHVRPHRLPDVFKRAAAATLA